MLSLQGKNILITGASSGIGSKCAVICSTLGANVILIGRDGKRLNETLHKLSPGNHLHFQQDVTAFEELEAIVSQSVEKIGKIAGFIHCAGIETTVPLQSMSAAKYQEIFAINTISAFEFSRILSKKKYVEPSGASFVLLSSIMGVLGAAGKVAYCSSKSALISGSKAMALELAAKKIRVNCVLPGMVETEMVQRMITELPEESVKLIRGKHPLGFGEPADVANLCAFLVSDLSKWITGTEIIIDGGYSCQ